MMIIKLKISFLQFLNKKRKIFNLLHRMKKVKKLRLQRNRIMEKKKRLKYRRKKLTVKKWMHLRKKKPFALQKKKILKLKMKRKLKMRRMILKMQRFLPKFAMNFLLNLFARWKMFALISILLKSMLIISWVMLVKITIIKVKRYRILPNRLTLLRKQFHHYKTQ